MSRASSITADWIAVDWGTTNLRAYAMGPGDTVLAEGSSDDGMGRLDPDGFEPALLRVIGDWLGEGVTQVLACCMVGARQGWVEAPYRETPCAMTAAAPIAAPTKDPRVAVQILPGVSQNRPADVMRGEETQVAGALHLSPGFDGVVCLPGTHTKWIHVSAGEIVSFQTAMSGEMFALLATQSVLRHSVAGDALDMDAYDDAVSVTLSRPERLAQLLFGIRADGLLHGQSDAVSRARLSGLLIGAELAATKPYWLGQAVMLGGAAPLVALYRRALAAQGVETTAHDARTLTLAGLCLARKSLLQ